MSINGFEDKEITKFQDTEKKSLRILQYLLDLWKDPVDPIW